MTAPRGAALFAEFEMNAFRVPDWFYRAGLSSNKPLLTMLRASWPHWAQALADGNENLAPIILMFNASPAEIKKTVGGHTWYRMREASTHTNMNRMVLRLVGGWSLDEAMEWPEREKRHAKKLLQSATKSQLLIACRHTRPGEQLYGHFIMARDFLRMGGTIDPTWGRKRLKREHDARAIEKSMGRADPTPWADPWQTDFEGYTIKLLTSEADLALEGIVQRHCVTSYAAACRDGIEIVFQIMGPERATASYGFGGDLTQVQGYANSRVLEKTIEAAVVAMNRYLIHLAHKRHALQSANAEDKSC